MIKSPVFMKKTGYILIKKSLLKSHICIENLKSYNMEKGSNLITLIEIEHCAKTNKEYHTILSHFFSSLQIGVIC